MAGDWIKFELATLDKPEVIAMADILETSTYDVVGRLLRVWGWFDQQTRNGNAVSVTGNTLKRFIDALVGSQGFASSMQKVGWLNDDGVPNFDRHNGKSAKDRALTNDRVKRSRNAPNVTDALPEKRREEKKKHIAITPIPDWVPKPEWDSFVEMRNKGKSPFTDRAKALALAELEKLRAAGHDPAAVINATVLNGWKSFYAPKGQAPAADPPWKGAH